MTQTQTMNSQPAVLIRGSFDDFAEFESLSTTWDLDFRPLDRGPSAVQAMQIMTERARYSRFRFERRYHQRGAPPAGSLNFGFPDIEGEPLKWRELEVGPSSLICFAPRHDYSSISRAGFSGATLSFDADHLTRLADALGMIEVLDGTTNPNLLTCTDPGAYQQLRLALANLARHGDDHGSGSIATALEEEIPSRLLAALASTDTRSLATRQSPNARSQARQRAVTFIEAHAKQAPSIRKICLAAGVSWRTLDYAFKEHFGITPKEYLQTVRLQGVREDIQAAGSECVIADIANHWGFWHLGQFAADYRLKFGELPSATRNG